MARKVIIDCDPGIDDAVALCLALFDPRLEVLAVTATAGNVSSEQASLNVQVIIERLDPPRLPRIGTATPSDNAPPVYSRNFHGSDGLGNSGFAVSSLHHQHSSEEIICDEIRGAPDEVTIITLGPLTNIARAFRRDPEVAGLVHRLIIMGGSLSGQGNATPAAEFNTYFDPQAARAVFRSMSTKTLIPLDVTRQVVWDIGLLDHLPDQYSRAGALLHKLIPFAFRAYHQHLGQESIHLHDAVALLAACQEELFEMEEMAGDVETSGDLTMGVTVFDRRPNREWRRNMEVATHIDAVSARDCIMRGFAHAGSRS